MFYSILFSEENLSQTFWPSSFADVRKPLQQLLRPTRREALPAQVKKHSLRSMLQCLDSHWAAFSCGLSHHRALHLSRYHLTGP